MSSTERIVCRYYMSKDIETYNKISIARGGLGVVCVAVGVVTWVIPFTTIPLLLLGGVLLGYDMKGFIRRVRYEAHLIKVRAFARMVQDE